MKIILVLLVLVGYGHCVKLPSDFKKCNRKDPDLGKCVLEAAQDGVSKLTKDYPKVNLRNLEPMEITEMKIEPGSKGVVNVEQHFKNCKFYGIPTGKFSEFRIDLTEKYLYATGTVEEIKKLCEYELNGKILLLPIVGTGASTVILKRVNITGRYDFEEVPKKGKHHIHFINYKLTLDPEEVFMNFDNLFNGDKTLGDNVNKVLNENNKEVYADVKSGYEDNVGAILLQIMNDFFAKVSIEEAFD